MCVAIPARILELLPAALPMARVDQAGNELQCCLAYVPEAEIGDYVLIQHGFAVEVLTPEAAALSLAAFQSLGLITSSAESLAGIE